MNIQALIGGRYGNQQIRQQQRLSRDVFYPSRELRRVANDPRSKTGQNDRLRTNGQTVLLDSKAAEDVVSDQSPQKRLEPTEEIHQHSKLLTE